MHVVWITLAMWSVITMVHMVDDLCEQGEEDVCSSITVSGDSSGDGVPSE